MSLILIKQPDLNLRNLAVGRDSKTEDFTKLNLLLCRDHLERLATPDPCCFHYYAAGNLIEKRKLAFHGRELNSASKQLLYQSRQI